LELVLKTTPLGKGKDTYVPYSRGEDQRRKDNEDPGGFLSMEMGKTSGDVRGIRRVIHQYFPLKTPGKGTI